MVGWAPSTTLKNSLDQDQTPADGTKTLILPLFFSPENIAQHVSWNILYEKGYFHVLTALISVILEGIRSNMQE